MSNLIPYTPELFEKMHKPSAKLIGASFAPALVLPAHQKPSWLISPYAMSLAMIGKIDLDPPHEGIVKRGKMLEPVTIGMLNDVGYEAAPLFHYVEHEENPHFMASPDYEIPGMPWGEGKAPVKWDEWEDDFPLYPQLQAQWTMFCGGTDQHLLSGLFVDRMNCDIKTMIVKRNDAVIGIMRERAEEMLENVEKGVACEPDESDSSYRALQEMMDVNERETIAFEDPEAIDRLNIWRQAKLDKKAAEANCDASRNWFAVRSGGAAVINVYDQVITRSKVEPKGKAPYWKWNP